MKEEFLKNLEKIKRGPAIMLQKDIGVILANTNINKSSVVLDGGSGCGVLTANLARFVKKVYSYDNRKEFLELAKENAKKFGLRNVVFKNKDVFEKIEEKDLDLITLDIKDSWRALGNAKKALKENGELVSYLPNISQVIELVNKLNKDFKLVKVVETIQRNWIVEEIICKPEHTGILHTGFLVFLKKI